MKSIHIFYEEKEYEQLKKVKDKFKMSWHNFVLYLAKNCDKK